MKRICIVLATRGNFAKMKTAMAAINAHPDLELQLVVGGALLNRQSAIVDEIRAEGFSIAATLDFMLASETSSAIGASAGLCLLKASDMLAQLQPDILVVIADRYEALALAQAAVCANVRIAHIEGGEISGSIDERIRHAITKLAHYHFPASAEAAERIAKLGEPAESILTVGSPSFDLLLDPKDHGAARLRQRVAGALDIDKPFLLVSQHPVVTEYGQAEAQYKTLTGNLLKLAMPVILIWPNNDAGADAIRAPLAAMQAKTNCPPIAIVAGLPIEEYGAALRRAACLVGNSSSGVREAAFLGTPAVNIGTRQAGRARSANIVDVACDAAEIEAAVRRQMGQGRFAPDYRYGDGTAGRRIAEFLAGYAPAIDKRMTY